MLIVMSLALMRQSVTCSMADILLGGKGNSLRVDSERAAHDRLPVRIALMAAQGVRYELGTGHNQCAMCCHLMC